ncbi:MAG TPA: glycosyltransferase family 9 protein [Victivallales bacterium]|nr:glycosyltransferase family 9 protein [Victivallales bacterium]HPO90275.1 glycosyltransferase family 9 protein [Victivallales bacterium]HRU01494.1 glycosyltransferase family 9 protein [Victivallales bacterium]
MNILLYRTHYKELLDSNADEAKFQHLCGKIAMSFLDRYYYNDEFVEEYIRFLCEIANSEIEKVNRSASAALFGTVIESLCDDFEELQTEAYNRVMSIIIDYCRYLPQGKKIDEFLNKFKLFSIDEIYNRAEKLRYEALTSCEIRNVKKVIVLSRVTIGADVAITGTMLQRIFLRFPDAELTLIGSSKLAEIYGGNKKIKIVPVLYQRRGSLFVRILSWLDVLELIEKEISSLSPIEYILIDTDSRLSQLGTLPLVPEKNYLFFRSRGDIDISVRKLSMPELVNFWADKVFGKARFSYPKLYLPAEIANKGSSFIEKIRNDTEKIIFINLGVGGNQRKRIEGNFEYLLLERLLKEEKCSIVLDKGFGEEELNRVEKITKKLKTNGFTVLDLKSLDDDFVSQKNSLYSISANIGEAAAMIAASDLYIGYDSACQHIAAALEIKTITIFAGTNNTRFVRRWRAFGKNKSYLIHVDTLTKSVHLDENDIIERILDCCIK